MKTSEQLQKWQEIENQIKALTGTSGWFLSMGARFPKIDELVLISQGCSMDELKKAAKGMANIHYHIDGPVDNEQCSIRIKHTRHYGD